MPRRSFRLILAAIFLAAIALPVAAQPAETAETGTIVIESTSTTVVVSPPAPAEPSVVAPEPVPPQQIAPLPTHDGTEVSHIHGQPVKVGEQNESLHRGRRTNISSNPIGWIAGFWGVSVSHGLTQNIAIRGDINMLRPFFKFDEIFEVGIGVPLYLRRIYHGVLLEPGFIVRAQIDKHDCDAQDPSCRESDTTVTFGPQILAGWHWTWDSGFNIATTLGAGRNWSPQKDEGGGDPDELFFNGYFRVGYAF